MVTSNPRNAKKLIYDALRSSASLNAAMGVASGTGIKHGTPKNKAEYPCVTYNIPGGVDEPYNPDQPTGIEDNLLRVEMFSATVDSDQIDEMSRAVKETLHGQNLYDPALGVKVFSLYRESWSSVFEPEIGVWHAWHRYRFVNKS